MTPMEIGKELVALCRQKKNLEAIDKFYSPTVESVEAEAIPQIGKVQKGVEAIKGKNRQWFENSQSIHRPLHVRCHPKTIGQTDEHVGNGTVYGARREIAKEEFFYSM